MYTESSNPRASGDRARLISPLITATSGKCLRFFYHMRGQNIGTLNVYEIFDGQIHSPIWTVSGQQFDKWLPAQVTLVSPLDFQVS